MRVIGKYQTHNTKSRINSYNFKQKCETHVTHALEM